jgi:Mce-associated membrane protein
VTAVLDANPHAPADESPARPPLGSWWARVGAFAVDVFIGAAVIVTVGLAAVPQEGWLRWLYAGVAVLTFLVMAVNRLLLPTITGWSLGRALFGIAVRNREGAPVGILRLTVREVAHVLDTAAVFTGWLWPLWDRRNRTFADLLARTEVHKVEPPQRDVRRPVVWVLVAATMLCAAAVGLSYAVVYRHDRAVDQARAQISEQGPRIVEKMLSFGADTLQQDFSTAQSLTTDGYRPQLIAQQQVVQKAGATTNEYWAVSSAILSVSTEQASMLMAMQGQRGADPNTMKFITATVRVEFDRSGDGQWRVANLTVLKRPNLNQAGQ